jgi:hypothetical protein
LPVWTERDYVVDRELRTNPPKKYLAHGGKWQFSSSPRDYPQINFTSIARKRTWLTFKRAVPKVLLCGSGSDFTSQAMDLWAYHNRVKI